MKTIFVVEDTIETNEAICEYLKELGYNTISSYDGKDVLNIFNSNKDIDLIILDVMLPKITGISILHEVRKVSNVPVIMLTALDDEYTQISSFNELSDDYITKPFSMIILGKRVEALLRRTNNKSNSIDIDNDKITISDITIDFASYTAISPSGKIDITPKELQLLKLFISNKNIVLTREQILDTIWGNDAFIIDRTIDTYVKNLRHKLNLTDTIITVKGVGYKYEVNDEKNN